MIKAHYEHALNNTSIEVIKERVFGGTYFSDIYSGVNPIQDGPFQGLSRMGGGGSNGFPPPPPLPKICHK